ncbi:tyrosine-type recombinase/integrase [Permianibacter aggregans]|uniref:Site-specific recombinase XerD n=1 Tax=Permianibacter aggregans TaxID=1510150 RepID=A0A4V3D804_9GAMM|nr:site-specific integrase [Permianibacter aggregans]QGX39379.1 site-specific integrase [Permianibacter aggregans]TDQ49887.1 site-specific recombinase XerD [Permianibacter aggregans]
MNKYHPENERIKRDYFCYLKEAKRQSDQTVDAVAKALARFEAYNKWRDFKAFQHQQAVAFKQHMTTQKGPTGEKLSKATLHATMAHLKRFFQWLAWQPGYKSRIQYSDAEYFNLSEKDVRVAKAKREKAAPTLEQIQHVIGSMPRDTEIERRNLTVIAFTLLTGARDGAIASAKLKHVDLAARTFFQDAREVNTKFSKTFTTTFFPVGESIEEIVSSWVRYLRDEKLWGLDDPLFPATAVEYDPASKQFEATRLSRKAWSSAAPIRAIFKEAFTKAGLPYSNPHSFRDTLVRLGEQICQSPEDFKAWSQNLGHEKVLTTFYSYGEVPPRQQSDIIKRLGQPRTDNFSLDAQAIAKAVAKEMVALGNSK